MTVAKLEIPEAKIGQFCRRNGIRKLALFGSVLTDRFSDSSDVDVLRSLHAEVGSDGLHRVCIELAWTEPGWTAAKPIRFPLALPTFQTLTDNWRPPETTNFGLAVTHHRDRRYTASVDETFRQHVESLHPSFERLMAMRPTTACALPGSMPERGVYLFSEGDEHLYVGRSNRLHDRLQEHCRRSSTHNSAPFAFILARKASGRVSASYQPTGSRAELERDPAFREAFVQAKERIGRMDIRFVEERDPLRQALLEMYVAIAVQTPHNSFENH